MDFRMAFENVPMAVLKSIIAKGCESPLDFPNDLPSVPGPIRKEPVRSTGPSTEIPSILMPLGKKEPKCSQGIPMAVGRKPR